MFDLKPEAPAEVRGPFQPITTSVPGIRICEHLARLAQRADRFSLLRAVSHANSNHTPMIYYLDALLGGLRIGDAELQQLAIRAIACCGPESVDYLIQVAAENIRHPDYCLRLLSAAEQGGHQPGWEMRMQLMLGFTRTKRIEIRDRAVQLFYSFAPHAQSCRGKRGWAC